MLLEFTTKTSTKIQQQTTTDCMDQKLVAFQETSKIEPAYSYTSETEINAERQSITEKSSTRQQKIVQEKYLFSTKTNSRVSDQMETDSNKNLHILKTMSDIRGLFAFIVTVLCVIICWKICIKFFKHYKFQQDSM